MNENVSTLTGTKRPRRTNVLFFSFWSGCVKREDQSLLRTTFWSESIVNNFGDINGCNYLAMK